MSHSQMLMRGRSDRRQERDIFHDGRIAYRSAKASVIGTINEHQFIDLYVVHLQIDR